MDAYTEADIEHTRKAALLMFTLYDALMIKSLSQKNDEVMAAIEGVADSVWESLLLVATYGRCEKTQRALVKETLKDTPPWVFTCVVKDWNMPKISSLSAGVSWRRWNKCRGKQPRKPARSKMSS